MKLFKCLALFAANAQACIPPLLFVGSTEACIPPLLFAANTEACKKEVVVIPLGSDIDGTNQEKSFFLEKYRLNPSPAIIFFLHIIQTNL